MKARHPTSRDCCDCSIKSSEVKNIVTEETTANELGANPVV